ncbi:MAG: hypothetical protein MUF83_20915 [Acidimicrobiales bacterium]|nr:hypothetical protein [Acidimicrobiales bacterium]
MPQPSSRRPPTRWGRLLLGLLGLAIGLLIILVGVGMLAGDDEGSSPATGPAPTTAAPAT